MSISGDFAAFCMTMLIMRGCWRRCEGRKGLDVFQWIFGCLMAIWAFSHYFSGPFDKAMAMPQSEVFPITDAIGKSIGVKLGNGGTNVIVGALGVVVIAAVFGLLNWLLDKVYKA